MFTFFDVAFDVRLVSARGVVPVDAADIVARFVGADFVEVHSAPFEYATVFAGEQVFDGVAGLQLELPQAFVHVSGHGIVLCLSSFIDGDGRDDAIEQGVGVEAFGFGSVADGDAVADDVVQDGFDVVGEFSDLVVEMGFLCGASDLATGLF